MSYTYSVRLTTSAPSNARLPGPKSSARQVLEYDEQSSLEVAFGLCSFSCTALRRRGGACWAARSIACPASRCQQQRTRLQALSSASSRTIVPHFWPAGIRRPPVLAAQLAVPSHSWVRLAAAATGAGHRHDAEPDQSRRGGLQGQRLPGVPCGPRRIQRRPARAPPQEVPWIRRRWRRWCRRRRGRAGCLFVSHSAEDVRRGLSPAPSITSCATLPALPGPKSLIGDLFMFRSIYGWH